MGAILESIFIPNTLPLFPHPRAKRGIISAARKDGGLGAKKLANKFNQRQLMSMTRRPPGSVVRVPPLISRWTVSRWLKKEGIYCCWAARKPLLSTPSIRKRLEFAKDHQGFDWSKVIFSDQKIWRLRLGGRVRVWRKKGERYLPQYVQPTTQKSVGIILSRLTLYL